MRALRAGSIDSPVVLAVRFDCRSRRAARGTVRPRAMSPRKRRSLVLPPRERRAKKRRKPVADGKVRGTVAGSRSRSVVKTALRAGNSSVEGASGREKSLLLTKRRRKRSPYRHVELRLQTRRTRERQRHVLPPRARSKTPSRRGAVRGVHRSRDPTRNVRRPRRRQMTHGAWSIMPKLVCAPSSALHSSRPLGLWLQRACRSRESVNVTSRVERPCRCSCRDCSCRSR